MNSTSIYLNGFTPNSTGRIWLGMKYWSNWVEIHWDYIICLPGRIGYHPNEFNWHLSQWIYSQFDRSNFKFDQAWNTGQIGWKFIVCLPDQIGYHPSRFTPNFTSNSCPVEFNQAWNTGKTGCKFTEITFVCLPVHSMATWSNLVVIISMDLLPIRPVKFQIWPGMKYWSNWVEIHWDYIVCLPGRIGYHLNGFTPNLTSNLCPVEFDRAWNNGKNGCKFTEITFVCLPVHSMATW